MWKCEAQNIDPSYRTTCVMMPLMGEKVARRGYEGAILRQHSERERKNVGCASAFPPQSRPALLLLLAVSRGVAMAAVRAPI